MNENAPNPSIRDRIKWWLYERCLDYCVRVIDPDADPDEFMLVDRTFFVTLSRDEAREMIEEAPDVAWRLEGLLRYE